MSHTEHTERRVRQLLELARRLAHEYFAAPNDDMVGAIFLELSQGGVMTAAPEPVAGATVH